MFSKGTGCCAPSSRIDWWRLSLSSTSSQRVRWRHCGVTSCWPSSGTHQRQCTCWAQSMMRPPCMSFSGTDQMPSSHPVLLTTILRWVLSTNRLRWLSPTMPPGKLCGGTRSWYPSAADFPAECLFSAWERWKQVGLSAVPGICNLGSAHFWHRKTCRSPGARWHQRCSWGILPSQRSAFHHESSTDWEEGQQIWQDVHGVQFQGGAPGVHIHVCGLS